MYVVNTAPVFSCKLHNAIIIIMIIQNQVNIVVYLYRSEIVCECVQRQYYE